MQNTTKSAALEVKDFIEGEEAYTLKGYASVFGNTDLDGDIIEKGAFTNSLKKRMPLLLWGHDQGGVPIGRVDIAKEDNHGLYYEATMPKSDAFVRDRVAPQLKHGSLKGNSIGFRIEEKESLSGGGRRIKSADLWEISLVTFPANEQAGVHAFKDAKRVAEYTELPLAERSRPWREEDALKNIHAMVVDMDDPAEVYAKAFLYRDGEDRDDPSSYKFLISDVVGGRLCAVPAAIYKSATALIRTKDDDLCSSARDALQKNLDRYYTRLDLPPATKSLSKSEWGHLDAGEREARLRAGVSLSGGLAKMLSGQRDVGRKPRDAVNGEAKSKELLSAIHTLTRRLDTK